MSLKAKRAIALLSGGLDSCVAVAVARNEGLEVTHALTVLYGQRHDREIGSAIRVSSFYNLHHSVLDLPQLLSGVRTASALLNPDEPLPRDRALSAMTARVPRSYVPGRNTIMLAIAQAYAEGLNLDRIIT